MRHVHILWPYIKKPKEKYCFFADFSRFKLMHVDTTSTSEYKLKTDKKSFYWPFKGKVKVQVYSLISSLKTYHPTLHLTSWSLDLLIRVPFYLHGDVLQLFQGIVLIMHIVISVLPGRPYSFSPESSEAFEGEVPCPRTQHFNNVRRLRGEKHDISLKILHQAGFETAQQAATLAKHRALTIAPRPSLM